jgi:hypothetical protein
MGLTIILKTKEVTIVLLLIGMKKSFGLRKREAKSVILIKTLCWKVTEKRRSSSRVRVSKFPN